MELKTEVDKLLIKLIQVGDGIETHTGVYPANAPVSERFGNYDYHAIVNVQMEAFGIPVHCRAIRAVWRDGVCMYRQGESAIQGVLL